MDTLDLEFFVTFLPYEKRTLTRTGVELHCLSYWAVELTPWVGRRMRVEAHYDPRDITVVWVRTPVGLLVRATVTNPGIPAISLVEWLSRREAERVLGRDPARLAIVDASRRRSDQLVSEARSSRGIQRRHHTRIAGDKYRGLPAPTDALPATPRVSPVEAISPTTAMGAPGIPALPPPSYFEFEDSDYDD